MSDNGGWVWMSRKIIEMKFFWETSDYADSDKTNKIQASSAQYSSASVMFQTEFMVEEFELLVAEE